MNIGNGRGGQLLLAEHPSEIHLRGTRDRPTLKEEQGMNSMNFISDATAFEAQSMHEFANLLAQADIREDEQFSTAVRLATQYHGITISEFVDEFCVSAPTVSRWAKGTSVPHVMARPRIISWIRRKLSEQEVKLKKQVGTPLVLKKSNHKPARVQ